MKNLLLFVSTDDYDPEFGIEGYRCTVGDIREATNKLDEIEYFDSAQLLEIDENELSLYAEFYIRYANVTETQRTRVEGWEMSNGSWRISRQTKQLYIPPPTFNLPSIPDYLHNMGTIIGPQGRWENAR